MKLKRYDSVTFQILINIHEEIDCVENAKECRMPLDSYEAYDKTDSELDIIVNELKDFGVSASYERILMYPYDDESTEIYMYLSWEN